MISEKDLLAKLEAVLAINEKLAAENKQQKELLDSLKANSPRNIGVGCNAISGVTLQAPNNEIEIDVKYGEIVTLTDDDVKTLLKRNSTRKLFTNGIVYFQDEREYANFGIRHNINLNDEKIIEVFSSGNEDTLVKYFDTCTSKKLEVDVMNTLFYKIVAMNMDGRLGTLSYELRVCVEKYFNMTLNMAEFLYRRLRNIL